MMTPTRTTQAPEAEQVLADTRRWLERAVIGLNLCPFASAVHLRQQIRWVVSQARSEDDLVEELARELRLLAASDPDQVATTLLIHPWVLNDFLDYNDFLELADATVEALDLEGVLQVASFHPQYQFADSEPEDISNFSNRSPFPTLHLLREDDVERAVEALPDSVRLYETNIETLRRLGLDGWRRLFAAADA
jgi:hypothetical protein